MKADQDTFDHHKGQKVCDFRGWETTGLGNWPEREHSQKCLREGTKGLLEPGSKGLRKDFCTTQNCFCTGAKWGCTGARGFVLPGSKRPFAPSPQHFWEFSLFGQFPRPPSLPIQGRHLHRIFLHFLQWIFFCLQVFPPQKVSGCNGFFFRPPSRGRSLSEQGVCTWSIRVGGGNPRASRSRGACVCNNSAVAPASQCDAWLALLALDGA